jgi:hypothetical protein
MKVATNFFIGQRPAIGVTMSDSYPPAIQRAALLDLAAALGSRHDTLRRDECGDWRIAGKNGHVYAVPGVLGIESARSGFHLFFDVESAKAWTYAKRALSFAKLTNDGDGDGALFLDRLPTKAEALTIRKTLGIAKAVEFAPEDLARRRERGAALTAARLAVNDQWQATKAAQDARIAF